MLEEKIPPVTAEPVELMPPELMPPELAPDRAGVGRADGHDASSATDSTGASATVPVEYPLHPVTSDYADFTTKELDALRMSVRAHGLLVPVVIWQGQIVDGRHRVRVCKEQGRPLNCCDITEECETEGQMRAYVATLNQYRRSNTKPLTNEQKRARTEAALKADPERSDQAIADEVGVTQPTVRAGRKKLEDEGVIKFITPPDRKSKSGKRGEGQRRTLPKPKNAPQQPPQPAQASPPSQPFSRLPEPQPESAPAPSSTPAAPQQGKLDLNPVGTAPQASAPAQQSGRSR
jgi:hypothetical protein